MKISEVSIAGEVAGPWQLEDIGWTQLNNDAEPLCLSVKDIAGQEKTIVHPNPEAVLESSWQTWQIPLNEFSMLDLANIESLAIGLGSRDNPRPGGAGTLYIDNIYLTLDQ